MNTNVLVPIICLLAVFDFTTPLGISLPHSLEFWRFQISTSGPFNIILSDGYLPDAGGGATKAAM